jgi:signal peptidase I
VERTDQTYRPPERPAPDPDYDQEPGDESDQSPRKERERRATAWEIAETILLALLIFLMVRGVVLNFRVDGNSMEPTLSNSEMLIVNRRAYSSVDFNQLLDFLPFVDREPGDERYLFSPPRRGDIVVFRPPGSRSEPYIKRIIGLPGETVEIHDGAVYVDGVRLDEPYVSSSTTWRGSGGESTITIPDDEYFVLGDNRSNSSDSRVFGTVPKENIIGKSWIAYWPPGSVQILPRPTYAVE